MTTKNKYIKISQFEQSNYPFLFIIGARGVGKTINSLAEKIKSNAENGTMFIYLRRYQSEIDTVNFNYELLEQLTGYEISREKLGNGKMAVDILTADGEPVAYLLALSTASKYKSNDYSKVTEIIYDEFIDMRGRELKGETKLFLNLCMTIFRDFSKAKVLWLANATDLYNCYFLDFEIMPNSKITKFSRLGIKIVMYQMDSNLYNEHMQSYLGRLVEHVEGEDGSSLHNSFDNEYNDFLSRLSKNSKYTATLKLNGTEYGLYQEGYAYCLSRKVDSSFKKKYAMTLNDVANGYPNIDYRFITNLINNFKNLQVYFTDVKTRSNWIRFFKSPYTLD